MSEFPLNSQQAKFPAQQSERSRFLEVDSALSSPESLSLSEVSLPPNPIIAQSKLLAKLSSEHGPHSEPVRLALLIMTKTPYQVKDFVAEGGESFLFVVTTEGSPDLIMKCYKNPPSQTLFCSEDQIGSYLREVEIPNSMNHPQIPKAEQVIRISTENSVPIVAIIRKKIEGSSLKERIKNGQYSEPEKLFKLLKEVAEILGYLHNHFDNRTGMKIIHSDIKPGNIMITDQGMPLLIDFSSARQIVPGYTFQHTVGLRGSLDYCPSEQFTGGGLPASDIYSLGITAYECLLGFMPPELRENWKQSAPFPLPKQIEVSKEFRKILEKMIHPDIEARYQNASQLLKDIESPDFPITKPTNSWWSQLAAPWNTASEEQNGSAVPLFAATSLQRISPPDEILEQYVSLETSQALYRSFSANIKRNSRMRPGANAKCEPRSEYKALPIDELSPIELSLSIPKFSHSQELESGFAALTRHTSAHIQYGDAFKLLNERITKLNKELCYANLKLNHSFATPDGTGGLLKSKEERVEPTTESDATVTIKPTVIEIGQLARLVSVIENLNTKVHGKEFVNRFLSDTLSHSDVYLKKQGQNKNIQLSDNSPVKARSIICGAITSLLESKQIDSLSIDPSIQKLLGNYLTNYSDRIPSKIMAKFNKCEPLDNEQEASIHCL